MTTTERINHADCGHPCPKCGGPRIWQACKRKNGGTRWTKRCNPCAAAGVRKSQRRSKDPKVLAERAARAQELASRKVGDPAPPCPTHGTPRTWRYHAKGWQTSCPECHAAAHLRRKDKANAVARANYQANKQAYKERFTKWRKANPQRYRDLQAKRRARVMGNGYDGLPVSLSPNAKCYICLSAPVEEIDHVIPLAKGGSDRLSNKAGACRACNRRKKDVVWPGSLGWDEFLQKRRGG